MILVAGPNGGNLATWATRLGPGLAEALGPAGELHLRYAGGHDGVTGVNQFQAWAMPDGDSALLFPGEAALAWLAGDDRVRFDIAGLIPLLAITSPGIMMWRRPATGPVRLASTSASRPALAGALALHLLGHAVDIVPSGLAEEDAVRGGAADAIFLRGAHAVAQARGLASAGLQPLFAAGVPGCGRDPAFPGVPALAELGGAGMTGESPLGRAWITAATASLVDAMLALPALSPAASVARWRRASAAAARGADGDAQRVLGPQVAAGLLADLSPGVAAQFALRDWLARQTGNGGAPRLAGVSAGR